MSDWERECRKMRGRVLEGVFAHRCADWDFLPIDETCDEWPCVCESDIKAKIAAGTWGEATKPQR